jgi:hypothetical protein
MCASLGYLYAPVRPCLGDSLSAFSHSELWTNLVGLREQEDNTQPRALVVHLPTLTRFCVLTVMAHDRAFDRRMQLAGHATWSNDLGPLPRL